MFKTELHCHSKAVSACSMTSAEQMRDIYVGAGYTTVVLTNHFSVYTYMHLQCKNWQEFVDRFIYGYTELKKISEGQLEILYAIELHPSDSPNDYLMYGAEEEFLRSNPFLYEKSPEELSKIARENGILFIQAHPFRDGMRMTNPALLDGVEVYNGSAGGHYGTDSRNDISKAYAAKFEFITTSGTDLHYPNDEISGGILTEEKITSISQLIEILKSGSYRLLQK